MKKILIAGLFFCLLLVLFMPVLARAGGGLVPCGNDGQDACTIKDFFTMLINIYVFIVWYIATPLSIIAITVGGILIMLGAGNPGMANKGKTILYSAIIGLVLVFASYLIINTILATIGFKGNWANPF